MAASACRGLDGDGRMWLLRFVIGGPSVAVLYRASAFPPGRRFLPALVGSPASPHQGIWAMTPAIIHGLFLTASSSLHRAPYAASAAFRKRPALEGCGAPGWPCLRILLAKPEPSDASAIVQIGSGKAAPCGRTRPSRRNAPGLPRRRVRGRQSSRLFDAPAAVEIPGIVPSPGRLEQAEGCREARKAPPSAQPGPAHV